MMLPRCCSYISCLVVTLFAFIIIERDNHQRLYDTIDILVKHRYIKYGPRGRWSAFRNGDYYITSLI